MGLIFMWTSDLFPLQHWQMFVHSTPVCLTFAHRHQIMSEIALTQVWRTLIAKLTAVSWLYILSFHEKAVYYDNDTHTFIIALKLIHKRKKKHMQSRLVMCFSSLQDYVAWLINKLCDYYISSYSTTGHCHQNFSSIFVPHKFWKKKFTLISQFYLCIFKKITWNWANDFKKTQSFWVWFILLTQLYGTSILNNDGQSNDIYKSSYNSAWIKLEGKKKVREKGGRKLWYLQ